MKDTEEMKKRKEGNVPHDIKKKREEKTEEIHTHQEVNSYHLVPNYYVHAYLYQISPHTKPITFMED